MRIRRVPLSSRYLYISAIIAVLFALVPAIKALPTLLKAIIVLSVVFFSALNAYNSVYYISILGLAIILNLLIWFGEYQFVSSFSFFDKFAMLCLFWLIIAIGVELCVKRQWNLINRLKRLVFFLFVLTSVTTIIGSFVFNEASRALASGDSVGNTVYQIANIGGYGFIYTLALSVPCIVYKINTTKEKKFILVLLLFLVCIIRASYATAIILSLCGLVMSFFLVKLNKTKKSLLIFYLFSLLILVCLILILDVEFWDFLIRLTAKNDTLNFRVRNLRDLVLYQNVTGDIAMRADLYFDSLKAFVKSPITGNVLSSRPNTLGYHSEFLDLLGGCGVLGAGVFVLLVSLFSSLVFRFYKGSGIGRYYVLAMIELLFFGFINTILGSIEFSIIIGLLYLPEGREELDVC